jgi:hypothetical protein
VTPDDNGDGDDGATDGLLFDTNILTRERIGVDVTDGDNDDGSCCDGDDVADDEDMETVAAAADVR